MDIKDVLLKYREENNISQRELARRCGLSNSLISILEMGVNPQTGKKMSPDLETYKKLADGMGITVQELFEMLDENEMVSMSIGDTQKIVDEVTPQTSEARILARGIDKLPKSQREQALAVVKAMFAKYADYFTEDKDDEA